jgi:hypothetical protein
MPVGFASSNAHVLGNVKDGDRADVSEGLEFSEWVAKKLVLAGYE